MLAKGKITSFERGKFNHSLRHFQHIQPVIWNVQQRVQYMWGPWSPVMPCLQCKQWKRSTEIPLFLQMTYSSMGDGGTAPHFLSLPLFLLCAISCLSTGAEEAGKNRHVNPSSGPSSSRVQLKRIKITALPHNWTQYSCSSRKLRC